MKAVLQADGATWDLNGGLTDWLATLPLHAASAIENALEDGTASTDNDSLTVTAATVSRWPEATAVALGLPGDSPFGFDVRLSGVIGRPGATVSIRWLQPGKTVPARDIDQQGLRLAAGGTEYRVPSPMFEVLGLVSRFNAAAGDAADTQFRIWAEIRETLGEDRTAGLTDGFLRSFRVVAANSLTFGISTDARGDVQIDPVLLVKKPKDDEGNESITRALTEVDESTFFRRIDELREGAAAFPITQGTYVVVSEPLRRTLSAVKRLRSASPEQRKRAAMFPEATIRETLEAPPDDPVEFIETEKFAERVRDIGAWEAPVLPWVKIETQDWTAPTAAGVRINGQDIPLELDQLDALEQKVREGVASGAKEVTVGPVTLPASKATLTAIQKLQKVIRKQEGGGSPTDEEDADDDKVLIIETNFNEVSFTRVRGATRPGAPSIPPAVRTSPKPHQETGLLWLQRHWITGSRGCLLCDDMGLGKTFQALAFLSWLRELMEAGTYKRRPMLIVAPVGLLRNWEAEIDLHLMLPGLGDITRAYGEHLRTLRRGSHLDGTAGLDTAILSRSDLILANYEAVSDYQLSFGAVAYSAVIFDEAQKIKSPKARMTHAAKALDAEFIIGMTGTPVENRLADLWCIADTAQPGGLATLKDFSARYEVEGADVGALRQAIWQEEQGADDKLPQLLLRRLKSDNLKGLPKKHEHIEKVAMPARQREAYQRALAMRELSGPEGTLGMIHALRRVSLHPLLLDGGAGSDELRIEDSARFIAAIGFLDRIAEAGEKCLIFLESLDLQEADQLPLMLKRRYGLARLPMVINGEVTTEDRQQRVNTFQAETGFDVMLLSPKAGGVGLTLTAANHVIHLSRWWNPAVEDQCSDRVYRIGQRRDVHIYYPLAVLPEAPDRSFDTQLQLLMERKRALARNLLAAPTFNRDDYDELLRNTR
jgi:hypothetical protein